ncbi:MAG: cation diffusion facilitator family transporter [Acidobacteriota bacterium]|nr:cation diffusion facilitator family transporter [Acidobacteriota bacterium]
MKQQTLSRFAWLSILAAILTIGFKTTAYFYTGSVGLLSDALESLINLVAAIFALTMIKIAAQPPDEDHTFGHDKAEYFASGIEGTLIFIAALSIAYAAGSRLLSPQPVENISLGLIISSIATIINLLVGRILIKAGRQQHSIILEADGRHLMADVWTSVGVVIGVLAVKFTGWFILDPIVALLVAVNIVWIGFQLIRRSVLGLMDTVVTPEVQQKIVEILDRYVAEREIDYHALRTRAAGARKFISVHILVPDEWTVQRGHDLVEEIENEIRGAVSDSIVFTHLEPLEDPISFADLDLFRQK